MANFISSPNMNLPVPIVGQDPGPDYATNVNTSLNTIDGHTHLPGSGVFITPGAIDINESLTFQNNFATNLAGVNFYQQTASVSAQTLYVKLGTESTPLPDLFYFDGINTIQLTAGGNVNATAASIPGESYAGGTFTWRQGSGSTLPASFDIGAVTLRNPSTAVTSGTGYVDLTVPSGIGSSQYNIALPLLPSTNPAFLTIDTAGNISSTSSTVNGITRQNLVAVGQQISSSSGAFSLAGPNQAAVTNLSVTITTTGRPVMVMMQPASNSGGQIILSTDGTHSLSTIFGTVYFFRSGSSSSIAYFPLQLGGSASTFLNASWPPGSFSYLDVVGAGTYTYTVQVLVESETDIEVSNTVLVAYEL